MTSGAAAPAEGVNRGLLGASSRFCCSRSRRSSYWAPRGPAALARPTGFRSGFPSRRWWCCWPACRPAVSARLGGRSPWPRERSSPGASWRSRLAPWAPSGWRWYGDGDPRPSSPRGLRLGRQGGEIRAAIDRQWQEGDDAPALRRRGGTRGNGHAATIRLSPGLSRWPSSVRLPGHLAAARQPGWAGARSSAPGPFRRFRFSDPDLGAPSAPGAGDAAPPAL
jgi:hypothetical protein